MECFICVNEFLSSKIFFSSPVRKNNFPFEKYRYTESRRYHDDVTSRRKKNSSSEDRNGRSKLTTNSLIWSVREYSAETSSSDTNLARLLLLFPPFLFSNRRNRDCSTWLYDNIFDIESIRGNRGSVLRASFIGKHTIG